MNGIQPFKYAAVEAAQALDDVEASFELLPKRGSRKSACGPEVGTPLGHCGRACRLERAASAGHAHAPIGAGCGVDPGW